MSTIRKTLIISLLSLILVSGVIIYAKNNDPYKIETFNSEKGWGYRINKDGKIIILQECVPCVVGNKPFPDEESALNTGKLVLSKIKKHENPSVTIEELNLILKHNK